jgi:MFS family permease
VGQFDGRREKRRFILGFGTAGRLALFLVAFAATPLAFSIPVVFSITLATAVIPALNALFQTNYTSLERGRVFGWVMSVTALATILASMGAGAWLDADHRSYRIIYPTAGVLGLGASFLYYRIRQKRLSVALRLDRRAHSLGRTPRSDLLALAGDWLGDVQRALQNPLKGSTTSLFTAWP